MRLGRVLAALAVAAGGLLVTTRPAPAATGTVDGPSMALVAQPVGIELGGLATITVQVTGAPPDAEIDASIYPPVTAAGVADARNGRLPAKQIGFVPRAPLAERTNADGTASVVLRAVDTPPRFDEEVRMGAEGVYPVRLRVLADDGSATLAQLVTFLVRPGARRLPITVVLPLPGAPSLRPDGTTGVAPADQDRAQAVTQLLAALPDFPFTLAPRPELLAALGRTNPVLTSRLAGALGARSVLALPFVRLDVSGMVAADLAAEVGRQLAAGEQAIAAALPGTRPDRRVWLADGALDDAALATLRTLGVQHLLTAPERLDPQPAAPVLHPLPLMVGGDTPVVSSVGSGLGALVADTGALSRLAPQPADVTAAVVDVVADLSARAFEDEVGRGLVLEPPSDWTYVPAFWTTLASALRGPTMVTAVGLDEFLRVTTPQRDATYRLRPDARRDELGLAQSLFVTRVALTQMGSVLPTASTRFAGLTDRTTVATSADLTDAQRAAYFDAVTERVNPVRNAVTVRVRDRITLAGKNGTIPLSLVNSLDESVSVRVRVSTDKLRVTDNDRLVVVPAGGELPLRIAVEARTSAWQFPANVSLATPDGTEPVGAATVLELRAVGLSGLGLGISFGALAVLATWWITSARRRRKAKRRVTATLVSP